MVQPLEQIIFNFFFLLQSCLNFKLKKVFLLAVFYYRGVKKVTLMIRSVYTIIHTTFLLFLEWNILDDLALGFEKTLSFRKV